MRQRCLCGRLPQQGRRGVESSAQGVAGCCETALTGETHLREEERGRERRPTGGATVDVCAHSTAVEGVGGASFCVDVDGTNEKPGDSLIRAMNLSHFSQW